MATSKKITRVQGGESTAAKSEPVTFTPTPESKGRAKTFRTIAIVGWVLAIACEAYAIYLLQIPPVNTTILIVLIVVALILAVAGSLLWKKANRFDPASEKDKFRFFVQNQLGAIMAVIAFLPLVIMIFTNKNLTGKQKGLVGTIAAAALVIAGITGIDYNPPSQEQYLEQTKTVESLNNGFNHVYWTKSGKSYHIFSDCSYINTDRTDEIFEGTVAQARELKNITDLCDRCQRRAEKERGLDATQEAVEQAESVIEEIAE